jgi:hypothetical protein
MNVGLKTSLAARFSTRSNPAQTASMIVSLPGRPTTESPTGRPSMTPIGTVAIGHPAMAGAWVTCDQRPLPLPPKTRSFFHAGL